MTLMAIVPTNGKVLKYLIELGKITLPIYLLHSLFVGVIVYATNRHGLEFLIPFRPIITLGLTIGLIEVYKWMVRKLNLKEKGYYLIGLKA